MSVNKNHRAIKLRQRLRAEGRNEKATQATEGGFLFKGE
jgi:hypothetical protein